MKEIWESEKLKILGSGEIKDKIKESVKNYMFPEEMIEKKFKGPMMVTTFGSLTEFNISINNGIYHMLNYCNNKTYMFDSEISEKFKSLHKDFKIFDGKKRLNNPKRLKPKKAVSKIIKIRKYGF